MRRTSSAGRWGGCWSRSSAIRELKSNQNFLALQSQLEGTENRVAVARRDYIQAVQAFNTEIRTFPGVIWARAVLGRQADGDLHGDRRCGAASGGEVLRVFDRLSGAHAVDPARHARV